MGLRTFTRQPDRLPPEYVRDQKWLLAHLDDLVARHPDKWIAVLAEKVVAVGDDLDQVTSDVEARHPDTAPVFWFVEGTPRVYAG